MLLVLFYQKYYLLKEGFFEVFIFCWKEKQDVGVDDANEQNNTGTSCVGAIILLFNTLVRTRPL